MISTDLEATLRERDAAYRRIAERAHSGQSVLPAPEAETAREAAAILGKSVDSFLVAIEDGAA